ncbi:hypothetical protein ESCOCP366M_26070 [Escherichia coli]
MSTNWNRVRMVTCSACGTRPGSGSVKVYRNTISKLRARKSMGWRRATQCKCSTCCIEITAITSEVTESTGNFHSASAVVMVTSGI